MEYVQRNYEELGSPTPRGWGSSLKDLWIDEMKNRGWDIGVTGDGNDYDLACQESLEQARIRFFSTFHNRRV